MTRRIYPLIVDVFAYDYRDVDAFDRLVRAPEPYWNGLMLKGSDGLTNDPYAEAWLKRMWRAATAQDAATDWWGRFFRGITNPREHERETLLRRRLGRDFFATSYHYWRRRWDGRAQARHHLAKIGGPEAYHLPGAILHCVDVEEGNNRGASAQEVIDGVSAYVEEHERLVGKGVIAYFGWWLRELFVSAGVKNTFGAQECIVAAYTPTLDQGTWRDVGFKRLGGWQYCGDGYEVVEGYPGKDGVDPSPMGPEDVTAWCANDGSIESLRAMTTTY